MRASELLGLLALAVAAGTISNLTAGPTRSLQWIGDWEVPDRATPTPEATAEGSPAATAATPAAGFEIGTAEAIVEHQSGALFLDARPTEAYQKGRIPGARAFAAWEADTDRKVVEMMTEFPPDQRIVVYCTGGKCEDSHVVRGKLLSAGFNNILVDKDGIPGWQAAGQPLED